MKLAEHQVMRVTNTPTILIDGELIGAPADETIVLPVSLLLIEHTQQNSDPDPLTWPDLVLRGGERTPQTEHLFARLDERLNPASWIHAPTPEQPYTEFNCAICEDVTPYLLPRVRSVSIAPLSAQAFVCEVTCTYTPNPAHYPASPWFRRYAWRLGDAQPEVISQLGLEVRS